MNKSIIIINIKMNGVKVMRKRNESKVSKIGMFMSLVAASMDSNQDPISRARQNTLVNVIKNRDIRD
jgi:hypothetical protein